MTRTAKYLATGILAGVALAFGGSSSAASAVETAPASSPARVQPAKDLSRFVGTYWYVPDKYLLAYVNVGGSKPAQAVTDQTLWHFTKADRGYLLGCSYRSIDGGEWSASAIIGSVAPNNKVLFGFYGQILTLGTGTLVRDGGRSYFLMQASTGPATNGVTHWAYMAQVTASDAAWLSLPGTNGQSVPAVDTGC